MRAPTEALKERKIPCRTDVPAASLSTFRVGGVCALVVEPRHVSELIETVALCRAHGAPYEVIGAGSNLLFDDGRIETVLIRTVGLREVRKNPHGLTAQCGCPLARLSAKAAACGFAGLTFACGIPGTVGGGVRMNAGAHGSALGDVLERVVALDPETGKLQTFLAKEIDISYRYTRFQRERRIILRASFRLTPHADPAALRAEAQRLLAARRAAQPVEYPSAGSAFRRIRPEIPLSPLLDALGLKGMRRGGAAVSEKHAGFIVNLGGARARDVRELIADIQNIVERETGMRPMPEICRIPRRP